jgi:hypothetical protein
LSVKKRPTRTEGKLFSDRTEYEILCTEVPSEGSLAHLRAEVFRCLVDAQVRYGAKVNIFRHASQRSNGKYCIARIQIPHLRLSEGDAEEHKQLLHKHGTKVAAAMLAVDGKLKEMTLLQHADPKPEQQNRFVPSMSTA